MTDLPEGITMEEYVSYKLLIGRASDDDLQNAPVDSERTPAFLTRMAKEEQARRQWRKMELDNLEGGMCYACECTPCRCALVDYYEDYSDADMGL